MEKEKEKIDNLYEEIASLEKHIQKIEKENYDLYERLSDLQYKYHKLDDDYSVLFKYTKHIQEYLCKDIFELMKEEYGDSYEE